MLNNLENAVSLNNLLFREGFPKRSKMEDGDSYLDESNSTSFIETTHMTLVKAFVYMLDIPILKNKSKKIGRFF